MELVYDKYYSMTVGTGEEVAYCHFKSLLDLKKHFKSYSGFDDGYSVSISYKVKKLNLETGEIQTITTPFTETLNNLNTIYVLELDDSSTYISIKFDTFMALKKFLSSLDNAPSSVYTIYKRTLNLVNGTYPQWDEIQIENI